MYLVKSIPKGNKSMSAYYQLPDLDNDTKGTFYFNTFDLSKIILIANIKLYPLICFIYV